MSNKKNWTTLTTTAGGIAVLIIAVVCLNIISSRLNFRLDLTQDRVFSLSDGTKRLLKKVDGDIGMRLYFSRSAKELPPMIKTYASRVEEVLGEYASRSGGKLTLEVADPRPDTDEEEWARKYGLKALPLPTGEQVFFGAIFMMGNREVTIPYFDPRREEFLEYDLSEAIVRVMTKDKVKIGILASLPVMGAAPMGMPPGMEGEGGQSWMFVEELKKSVAVEQVKPDAKTISSELKVLLVVHPKQLSEDTLYAIDQYLLRGGRLVVAVDPFSRVDLGANRQMAMMGGRMPETNSDLPKLFAAWDIEYKGSEMVGDLRNMTRVNAGGAAVAYPFYMSLRDDSFSKKVVVSAQLRSMLIGEGGALSLKEGSTNVFEPLIETSADSGVGATSMAAFMGPEDLGRELKADGKKRVVAALVRGTFRSAFPEGAPKSAPEPGKEPAAAPAGGHLAKAEKEGTIVVIADTDFMHDSNSVNRMNFGGMMMATPLNDNLAFVLNSVEFLSGNEDLISIRSRGKIQRPFIRLQDIQKNAQQRWKDEEEKLSKELQDLEKRLSEMQAQRSEGNRLLLSAAQQGEIERFRRQEVEVRKRRREVRKNLREDIEQMGNVLIVANMLIIPLAVGAFGFGVFTNRAKRMRKGRENEK